MITLVGKVCALRVMTRGSWEQHHIDTMNNIQQNHAMCRTRGQLRLSAQLRLWVADCSAELWMAVNAHETEGAMRCAQSVLAIVIGWLGAGALFVVISSSLGAAHRQRPRSPGK